MSAEERRPPPCPRGAEIALDRAARLVEHESGEVAVVGAEEFVEGDGWIAWAKPGDGERVLVRSRTRQRGARPAPETRGADRQAAPRAWTRVLPRREGRASRSARRAS